MFKAVAILRERAGRGIKGNKGLWPFGQMPGDLDAILSW